MIKTKISKHFKNRNAADLLNLPIVVTVNHFNEASEKQFRDDFQKAHDLGQPVIPVVISSYGGVVYSLLSKIDIIRNSKIPVATIVNGKAMSCGSVLFSCGAEGMRYVSEHSTVMIHSVSSMSWGKIKDMKIDVQEADRLNTKIFNIMARNVGKPDSYFLDQLKSKCDVDWYLTPEECKSINLANHVKMPDLQISASVKMKLE